MTNHTPKKRRSAAIMMTKLINYWGPFLGAGIRVKHSNPDVTEITVELRPRFFNKNIVGVHFGGSIYAMCDPFYMGILLHHLSKDYLVWDKAASIRFLKPGKGVLTAVFTIPAEEISAIKARADEFGKTEVTFTAKVLDKDNVVVAEVDKVVWVRNKHKKKPAPTSDSATVAR